MQGAQVVPEVRAHAEQIDDRHDITNSKERLDEWEPHVKHYASSRLEVAGRAKLAKGAAAIWGAIGSSNKMVQLIIVTRRKTLCHWVNVLAITRSDQPRHASGHIRCRDL